jgi:hypothetical protein
VTGFIVVVVALQLVLTRADKTVHDANSAEDDKDGALSFQQWAHGEFEAERGRLRAAEPALLILLPIAQPQSAGWRSASNFRSSSMG